MRDRNPDRVIFGTRQGLCLGIHIGAVDLEVRRPTESRVLIAVNHQTAIGHDGVDEKDIAILEIGCSGRRLGPEDAVDPEIDPTLIGIDDPDDVLLRKRVVQERHDSRDQSGKGHPPQHKAHDSISHEQASPVRHQSGHGVYTFGLMVDRASQHDAVLAH